MVFGVEDWRNLMDGEKIFCVNRDNCQSSQEKQKVVLKARGLRSDPEKAPLKQSEMMPEYNDVGHHFGNTQRTLDDVLIASRLGGCRRL